ncbi:dihydroorotate dehydrogenase electron transfer subunit [Microvirga massiliensis]|uniref:dihydroorotate dehydrogenase electron transfer subunit n=1 Tax=Microvirga massiliensis TaxID=1033741 RepID=UPI00062B75C5|nr:dihydroorotate dehydrogenase electron transfer subunit [Microvirga massiliensis]
MEALLDTCIQVPSALERNADDVVARVLSHEWVNSEYKHLILDAPDPAPRSLAGQFFNIECPSTESDKPFFRRPMSTYKADPQSGTVEFLYKVTGAGTRGLATLVTGQDVRILGPLGIGFRLAEDWRNIVVLGRGVGLATLAPLAETAASRGVTVTAVLSARNPARVMSVERFRDSGAQVEVVLDSDGTSAPANVEAMLRRLAEDGRADAFFTCGSNRLMLLMQRLGRELGIPGQVAMEQQMACGLGMCFCCVRTFKSGNATVSRRVCWEGPVFDLQEPLSW